ncbi:hypothetical protein [Hymenobacter edaphi]|uniref:hypothetical protein n=1 Tax=Hymenobacter edaphi TaxID=2211146 RepID=UPI0010582569|nr:hypothetical protein [Hymenobacter edaphi]
MQKHESQHQVHLDATTDFLGGDLQEAITKAGLDNRLQRWIEELKDLHVPELHPVVTDLQALKAHFGGGTLDHKLVGQLLHRLGDNTAKVTSLATEPPVRLRLENLGKALLEAAKQVAGGRAAAD